MKIFLNMNWIGTTKNPHLFIQMCKRSKLHDETIPSNTFNLPKDCSISYESLEREIHIRANSGRLCRPLLVVENRKLKLTDTMIKEIVGEDSDSSSSSSNNSNNSNNSKKTRKEVENDGIFLKNFNPTEKKQQQQQQQQERLSSNGKKDFINRSTIRWKDLLDKGIIEILDVYEEDSSLISMFSSILDDNDKTKSVKTTPQYSHCEINASSILGFAASSIPFPQCNQSPRVIYQTGMDKQSQGVSTTKPKYRVDKSTQTLWYPQYPLVTTTVASSKKRKQIPSGINAIIAILCYTGYNQEDSVIFNQSSIDRGFFRAFSEMTVTDIEKTMNSGDNVERFCNPFNASVKHFRFSQRECAHLDELGK